MGVGDGDIERIANDVDRTGGDREIDGGMAAIHDQGLVGLHEDQSIIFVGDPLLHLVPDRGDFAAMLLGRLEAQGFGIIGSCESPRWRIAPSG